MIGQMTGLRLSAAALILGVMPAAAADHSGEIAAAFEAHGMRSERAACFGQKIASELPAEEQTTAVALLREAASPDDIQLGVIRAGGNMVGAFTFADASCPKA